MRKGILKGLIALVLCVCLLPLGGCGSANGEKVAMGRYVEELLEFPKEAGNYLLMTGVGDGSVDVYFTNEDGKIVLYNTKDGEKWEEKTVNFSFAETEAPMVLSYDGNGGGYVLSNDYGGGNYTFNLYRMTGEKSLEKMDVKWATRPDGSEAFPQSVLALPGGGFLIGYGAAENAFHIYDKDGTELTSFGGPQMENYAMVGGSIFACDQETAAVVTYDKAGMETGRVPFEYMTDRSMGIGSGLDEAAYIYNKNGIFRLAGGGSMWEKVVDGELTSLSIPSNYFNSFVEASDKTFFLSCYDGTEEMKLARYRYDEKMASLPEKELVVYTLSENESLRQAAGLFQRSHPDTRVNIQVAADGSSATNADLIRTLNTELLNGKGPDILLLDGLPIESYVDKGILMDVTDATKKVEKSDGLLSQVTGAYKQKDGIFALPTKAILPVFFTDEETAAQTKTLGDLAAFAKAHPEKPVLGDITASRLAHLFMASCGPAFMNSNEINEDKLSEFLLSIKEIANCGAPSYPFSSEVNTSQIGNHSTGGTMWRAEGGKEESAEDIYHYAYNRGFGAIKGITNYSALILPYLAMEKQGGGTMNYMPGQADKIFIPCNIVGVNKNTQEKESAMDFVSLMLSESVQSASLSDGMPVNKKVLSAGAAEDESNIYMSANGYYNESETLEGSPAGAEFKKQFMDMLEGAKTPSNMDETLATMILEGAEGYFNGQKTLDKAVADIKEATTLYMAE